VSLLEIERKKKMRLKIKRRLALTFSLTNSIREITGLTFYVRFIYFVWGANTISERAVRWLIVLRINPLTDDLRFEQYEMR